MDVPVLQSLWTIGLAAILAMGAGYLVWDRRGGVRPMPGLATLAMLEGAGGIALAGITLCALVASGTLPLSIGGTDLPGFLLDDRFLGWTLVLLAVEIFTLWAMGRKANRRQRLLLVLVVTLSNLSVMLLLRLAPTLADFRHAPGLMQLPLRQMSAIVLGLGLFWAVVKLLPGRFWELLSWNHGWFLLAGVGCVVAAAVAGHEVNGRRLWLRLGPLTLQPVELAKVFYLLAFTGYLNSISLDVNAPTLRFLRVPPLKTLLGYLFALGLSMAPLVWQKDFGPVIVLGLLALGLFYAMSSIVWLPLAGALGAGGVAAALYGIGWPAILVRRTAMWLDPFNRSAQMAQAQWALAEGGVWGVGLGRGLVQYLPVAESDFIFTAIALELGMIAAALALLSYFLLAGLCLAGSRRSQAPEARLFLLGAALFWTAHVVVIAGGNLGILPLTGMALPFLSQGGSSMMANWLLAGLVFHALKGAESHAR